MIETLETVEAIATPEKVVCPSGVVSLLEMLQFYADFFVATLSRIATYERLAASEDREKLAKPTAMPMLYAQLGLLQGHAQMYGFQSISAQCIRIMQKMEALHMQIPCGDVRDDLKNLRERCDDELQKEFFLHLEPKQAQEYQRPKKEWETVVSRFHKVSYNIEESGKCYALERYGAAVFHVLQVAEYGVIQVAKLLQVEGDKPGWGALKRLSDLIKEPFPKRTALAQKHTKLLENVVPLAIVIKDSWRHKLDHVDNQIVWVDTDFSPEVAGEIISATRAFMRKLAKELP